MSLNCRRGLMTARLSCPNRTTLQAGKTRAVYGAVQAQEKEARIGNRRTGNSGFSASGFVLLCLHGSPKTPPTARITRIPSIRRSERFHLQLNQAGA